MAGEPQHSHQLVNKALSVPAINDDLTVLALARYAQRCQLACTPAVFCQGSAASGDPRSGTRRIISSRNGPLLLQQPLLRHCMPSAPSLRLPSTPLAQLARSAVEVDAGPAPTLSAACCSSLFSGSFIFISNTRGARLPLISDGMPASAGLQCCANGKRLIDEKCDVVLVVVAHSPKATRYSNH